MFSVFTNKINKICKIAFSIFFLIGSYAFAGTTGKIAGKVVDGTNNEPLIAANIFVVGTNYGAAADFEGNYFIINLPPGVYQLRISMIGYSTKTISEVRVSVDQTTKIDVDLFEDSIQLSDVVVSAAKPIVRKDLTSTESKVSGDDISMLPLDDVSAVVNLQAGVIDGHFRGGRSNEVKYLIDGIAVNDVYSGSSAMEVEVNSIEEIQVLTGTFNAEYGEAMSGVVNQITKIANNKYEGSISGYLSDYFTSRSELFQNIEHISPTDNYNIQGNFSGPIPGTDGFVKFFLSGRYVNDEGYLYGKRKFNPSDSSDFSANDSEDWYIGSTGDNEFVPMNSSQRYTMQGKLSFDVGSGKGIVLNGMIQNNEYRDYNHQYQLNPDGDYQKFQKSYLGSISYTHVISNAAFLDLVGSYFLSDYNQYVFENPLDSRYVDPKRKADVSGNAFLTGGTENWHFNHTTTTLSGKMDFTFQANNIHQFKAGLEYLQHDLSYEDYQIVIDVSTDFKPTLPEPGAFNFNIYNANPYQFAGYLQDKIELDYLIVNVGLRFDYFEPDGDYLKNPNRIAEIDQLTSPFPDSLVSKASAKYQLSPRIGLSYPITDRGAIHISYGHFFQIPPFEYLYRNPNFRIPLTGDFPENIGNTIGNTDLKPQQTIMYEIGLQQELFDNFGATLTVYHKDIRNLLATEIYIKNEFRKFSKLVNRDYASVNGLTLSFEKKFIDGFGATIDYTFQVAKGNASDPNDAFNKAQANPPIEANKTLAYLDWDRTHSFNFTLTAGTPGNYIISMIGKYGTGLPYTPSIQNQRTGLENSDRRPDFFNMDVFLTKQFNFFGVTTSAFIRIFNLLDTANELDVFSDTGRAGYTLELTRSQEAPRGVNTLAEYFARPDFYSAPRSINIGMNVNL
ncbi:MAG: TonB-dependent receptor [Ignavibacteriales bacterium CG18_big_fil_WC_8_21_14_2_50_31_20]|nr:MAG: TonB-dependent receptor [Ignavibacteriales bacterium CG18_big_fil_WC_8_21_14_2_50_31_20]